MTTSTRIGRITRQVVAVRVLPGVAAAAAAVILVSPSPAARTAGAACSPHATILSSPREHSREVQAKAINDRGDIVGFADAANGSEPIHAILWKGANAAGAVDLGVPPGYVSSEAYGINNDRVVFGVLYDRQERMYPFRWAKGRITLLKDPSGRLRPVEPAQRNAINARGEITATMFVGNTPRAVRWSSTGKATYLPGLPGHAWAWAFSINDAGIVSGWSRKLPSEDGEENPVLWPRSGKIVPLKTVSGQADGIAEATNRSGLTVGYLGNQTSSEPESDQFAVWTTRTAEPKLLGKLGANLIAEFVDVNDRGQAIGMTGTLDPNSGFAHSQAAIWQTGWPDVRPLAVPAASRVNPVRVTQLNDVNERGAIVGNVYGLAGKAYDKLRRIDPVLWTCAFGG
jgi:probable HAF family extracellular repeat protein